jgi:DNA mismatch repair protein MSH6
VTDIEYVEQQIKEQMGLFVGYFFEEFRKNQKIWEKFISIIAEIDCLISISLYSFQIGGVRPEFINEGFDIVEAKHPCLNAGDIIANDINLDSKVMLLTGPNMGGKSTLLRTTCLMVILAQMGSYVPAEKYSCEVIDRIFTRIGASDKL